MTATEIWITSIEIHNYQSHADTMISLVNGINAFVGPSNSGKSGVFRAVKWCLRNTPAGADFIRNGQDDCWVTTNFSHGISIKRRRTRSGHINTYEVFENGVPINPEPLTGFGTSVPSEVSDACGIEGFDYLFSPQLSPSYLIQETPSERAKTIGGLEELGRIDKALTGINDDIRDNTKKVRESRNKIESTKKKIATLEKDLQARKPKVILLRELKERVEADELLTDKIERSAKRLREIEGEITGQRQIIEKCERITSVWNEATPTEYECAKRLERALTRLLEIDHELSAITFINEDRLHEILALAEATEKDFIRYHRLQLAATRLKDIELEVQKYRTNYSPKVVILSFAELDLDIELFKSLSVRAKRLSEIEAEVVQVKLQAEASRTEIDKLLDEAVQALLEAEICSECGQNTAGITHEHMQATMI